MSEFAIGAGLVLAGVLAALACVALGYHWRGGWLRAAELERDQAQRDRDIAKRKLAAERRGHDAYAAQAENLAAQAARRAELARDPDLDDLEFADRVLFGAARVPAPDGAPAPGPADDGPAGVDAG